jgi:uncharacterized SAM-binding protein YcdF (DUF218 family)
MKRSTPERGGILWKLLFLILLLLVAGVIYQLRGPLLTETARLLIVDEKLQPADAIIVLGDDNYPGDRARHAARLYRERWAPRVVASGRYLRPYASVAELIRRDLLQHGVPGEHIIAAAHGAANTREEAFAMRRLAQQERWHRIVVVTSNYHTRRSRYIFSRVMPPEIRVQVSAAQDSGFDPAAWWHSRGGVKTLAREFFAWPVAVWEMSGGQKHALPSADPVPAQE